MSRLMLWAGLALAQCLLLTGAASAVTIDSGPMAWETSYGGFSGPDAAGGTFTASEDYLVSYTLFLGVHVDGFQFNELRGIVMATDGFGTPTGPVLWEGPSFEAIGPRSEIFFSPGLVLTLGEQYFIGVDSGLYTSAGGGDFTIEASAGSIPGGQYWFDSNGTGFLDSASSDIHTSIELTTNPEPTTGLLLGLGLGLLSWSQKNERARRHGSQKIQ